MNLDTLKYYIDKEIYKIKRVFININDWHDLVIQLAPGTEIHCNNWFVINDIYIHKNNFVRLNEALFTIINGDPILDESYSSYTIEILTEDEKIIKSIIE